MVQILNNRKMKNIIKIITLSFLGIGVFSGCKKDLLNISPSIITEKNVWSDANLINAYITNLYSRSQFAGLYVGLPEIPNLYASDEGMCVYDFVPNPIGQGNLRNTGGVLEYWPYDLIRDINTLIDKLPTTPLSAEQKNRAMGEAKFMRAYAYFEMVKRYGGVPLVTTVQDVNAGEALFVKRNTEKELYDFVAAEADACAGLLPDTYSGSDVGRISKYAALALKSRAMLYAGSEAKYGTLQLDGLVGMPAAEAAKYWQASYDASKAIIDGKKFELFNKYPDDRSKNYQMIFLEKDNSEIIFSKKYISLTAGHDFDDFYQTNRNYTFWGCAFDPYMELIDSYENKDGSSGKIDWNTVTGFLPEIFKNKDPRFHATILYNGMPWVKDTVEIWSGIYVNGNLRNSQSDKYQGMDEVGFDQKTVQGSRTGFLMKKYLDPTLQFPKPGQSSQDWIVFRYGEVLLNFAEAAFELGKTAEALDAINQIRIRAGIVPLTGITMDKIRHERRIEMVFEMHRFYDLRRWHTAVDVLNAEFHGALSYYQWEAKKFSFQVVSADGYKKVFKPQYYYLPITPDRINNNPSLKENPLY
jgi:hypothetical protein